MKRVLRWLKRLVLGAFALAVVAIVAVLIVVHTAWGRRLIAERIEAKLLESFPGGARVGTLEGSVFGTLVVSDIELSDLDHTPLVRIGSVKVELSLWPLLVRTAYVDSLLVEDVVITKHPQTLPAPPSPPPGSMTVDLPRIEVRRISAVVQTPQGPLTIDNASATASASVLPGGFVTATAYAAGTWRERAAPIAAVVGVRVGDTLTVPYARLAVGGVEVIATAVDVEAMAGEVVVDGSAAAIAQLVPEVVLPGDVNAKVTSTPLDGGVQVVIAGTVGRTAIDGAVLADLTAGTARGVISSRGNDLGLLTRGHVHGDGTVIVAGATDGVRLRATVIASGAVILGEGEVRIEAGGRGPTVGTEGAAGGAITGHLLAGIDATREHASVLVIGAGAGDARVAVIGGVRLAGDQVIVERTLLGASTRDPSATSGGMLPVTGALGVEVSVEGPTDAIVLGGQAHGTRLAFEDVRIAKVGARFAATISPGVRGREVLGTAHADLAGVVNAGSPIGGFTFDVKSRRDGTIAISTQARLAAAPVIVDASALITPGAVIDIALGPHRVRTEKGELRGTGGSIQIGDEQIVVRGIKTAPVGGGADARVTVDATVGRLTKTLVVAVDAREIPASLIDPAYRGTANAELSITRRGTTWSGGGTVTARGIAIAADTLPIDGEAKVTVAGRRVTLEGHLVNATVGGARIAIEVDGPRDLTDAAAWMRVKRGDLHAVTIGVERVDLAALTDKRTAGTAHGTLVIRDGVPSGSLAIRGIPTPIGMADADVTLSLTDVGFVDAIAKAKVGTLGAVEAQTRLQIPDRVFDPAAWKALGPRVIHSATVRTTDVAFDSRLLAQLGFDAPYAGRATAEIVVGAGGSSVDVTASVRDLHGGLIKRGIAVEVSGRVDDQGSRGTLHATSGALTLLDLPDARSPVTLDALIAAPKAALASRIEGTLTIPRIAAREVLAILGRTDITQGSIEGKIAIGGTVAVPTAVATVDVLALRVKPRLVSKPVPMLTALHIDASWDGTAGKLHVTGSEENKGTLVIDASGRPDRPEAVVATLKITNFDLAPLAVFLPGPLVGARGKLEADLTITGLDPSLGKVIGFVHLIGGRVPIAPRIGTLRRADARIDLDAGGVTAKLEGRIGAGTVKLMATTTDLKTATLSGEVSKFSPIGSLQPVIDGRINGTFEREGKTWRGTAKVTRASILVPEQKGNELLDAAAPDDLIFVDRPIPLPKRLARAPERPFLIANVEIASTRITVPELSVVASATGQVEVSVGETIGLDGEIVVETGTLVIAGHRYRVEVGQVGFDGTTDALLDIKLAHDFPDVTTYVRFAGRVSAIDKLEPLFTSEPGIYSQGQLLGFFLGGAPGGDPSKQTAEAAAGFGASIASTVLGKRLKRVVPLLDRLQIGCKPVAGQSSASCSAGTWFTKRTYVTFEQRIDSRPDENSGEGKVEYYWKPNRALELTGGDRGFFGLDLLWRHRW